MDINLKTIAFAGLMAFSLISCKKEQENGRPIPANQKTNSSGYRTADSTVTNISPDSTQAEPSAITKP